MDDVRESSQKGHTMHRRDLLNTAVAASAASILQIDSTSAAEQQKPQEQPARIVDTNVDLFHWPCRRLPLDDVDKLLNKFKTLGITEAWAGSFEAILHRDIGGVNLRLADVCRKYPQLIPIGSVNPTLPDWEEDLRLCSEHYRMPGVRLHPNYHGYELDDPRIGKLVERATKAGRFVQIAAAMEDIRTQHDLLRVSDVDLSPIALLTKSNPKAKIQILNYRPGGAALAMLAKLDGVFFDTARVEATDGVATLLKSVSADRVLFGTHAPFLIPDAALIRVHESDLDEQQLRSTLSENADRISRANERVAR
jgi:predicted TIM-barrel fold metal-dependent hydrolase